MKRKMAILGFILIIAMLNVETALSAVAVQPASGWSIQTVDSDSSVGEYCSLALDSAGRPHISYLDETHADLKYAKWTGTSWSIEAVDSAGTVGDFTSIALDSSNNPRISYYDIVNSALKYARWTGASWSIQTVDSAGVVGTDTSIALDSNNNPHISYYDATNGNLKYANWTSKFGWRTETVDSAGIVGYYTSIALDSSNNPHISYYDLTNGNLKYAKWTGSGWSIQTVDSSGVVGAYTSLALDSAGRPRISYNDATNTALKYARWTGTSWSIQTVDSAGNVGIHTSLALDSANNPHISYNDVTNSAIKYAVWTGSWSVETVGSVGGVSGGSYTSIAVDSSNNPHISYHDEFNDYLKYAHETPSLLDTELDFWFTPNPANPGQTVTLLGTLEDEYGTPMYPAQVKMYYSPDGGTTWNYVTTLNTDASGAFSKTFAAPAVGSYLVAMSYAGSATYNPSSDIETLTVQPLKLDTKVQFTLWPNPVAVPDTVTLQGTLSDVSDNPIGGATLQIYARDYHGYGSWQLKGTLSTNPSGYFQATGTVTTSGGYQIAVYYAGSSQYKSSYSIEILETEP